MENVDAVVKIAMVAIGSLTLVCVVALVGKSSRELWTAVIEFFKNWGK